MARPRLLFLAHCLPSPQDEGVKIRTYNLMRQLSLDFDVRALCFYRKSGHSTPESIDRAVAELSAIASTEAFPIPQEHSTVRTLWDHARSVARGVPYTHYAYESIDYSTALEHALRTFKPDVVHLDSLDLSFYLNALPALVPVVCGHHNVESELLKRRSLSSRGLVRFYLGLQARLLSRAEHLWMKTFSLNVVVSDSDLQTCSTFCPPERLLVVPNGVDTKLIEALPDAQDGIVFVGGSSWFPNKDALDFYCSDILPHIRAEIPDVSTTWVGNASASEIARIKATYGVQLTGYVDSIEPYVTRAGCYVVPLRVGGGTRLKILYAWAMRRAVVSTSIGCEGLESRDSENILIRDHPESFAKAVVGVLRDAAQRNSIAEAGRETACTVYDWDVVGGTLRAAYRTLVNGSSENLRRER